MRKEQIYEIMKAEGKPMNAGQILMKMGLELNKGNRLSVNVHLFNLKKAGRIVTTKWGVYEIAPVVVNPDSVPKVE